MLCLLPLVAIFQSPLLERKLRLSRMADGILLLGREQNWQPKKSWIVWVKNNDETQVISIIQIWNDKTSAMNTINTKFKNYQRKTLKENTLCFTAGMCSFFVLLYFGFLFYPFVVKILAYINSGVCLLNNIIRGSYR